MGYFSHILRTDNGTRPDERGPLDHACLRAGELREALIPPMLLHYYQLTLNPTTGYCLSE